MNTNVSIKPGLFSFIEVKTPEEQLQELINHYNDFECKRATPNNIRSMKLIEDSIYDLVKRHNLIVEPSVSHYLKAFTW